MTFSDRRIIDAVNKDFVPVWETVSPARIATYDLGGGDVLRGTVGGEIALYFCRPDGVVFDCLPALQSARVTHAAIERAANFYRESGGAPDEAIRRYNHERREIIARAQGIDVSQAELIVERAHLKLWSRLAMGDHSDDDQTLAAFSKTIMVTPAETVTVVEPGGLWLYAIQVHDQLARGKTKDPKGWKHQVFETILGQGLTPLPPVRLDETTLAPMSLHN